MKITYAKFCTLIKHEVSGHLCFPKYSLLSQVYYSEGFTNI
jgi:hypothetical protein